MPTENRMVLGKGSIAAACCAAVALLAAAPACSTKVRRFGDAGAGGGGGDGATASAGGGGGGEGGGGRTCEPGSQDACYSGPPETLNRGVCRSGLSTCDGDGAGHGPCAGEVLPAADRCDTADDEDCDGVVNKACRYARCGDVPPGSPSGVYLLDLDGSGPAPEFPVHCDLETDGGGWALVYNSVGSEEGTTLAFWDIPYEARLGVKGEPGLGQNFYRGSLYFVGREYRDEIEDMDGTVKDVVRATAEGIDSATMKLLRPSQTSGDAEIFFSQFFSGWSSQDFDGDPYEENCALRYQNVTQHYAQCWAYNLGADGDEPLDDGGWGPHLVAQFADRLGLAGDGSRHTRVKRISRWTRW
ncbi:hypothetical protein SOCE26_065660 [Sorangium cellulosum]|uniref:Fibrinogen C-terminal domain-containing protein n=1 Tax=Sorangium cellulosum TaxID=56 RepID=A0A2L0F0K8_SORCE|nr:fibrinogen-like YCDxxxxGGGW domain-containing protein [Sorangium cellulosum]AUX45085.1 hypothetical protein SOCE26_065660 [Sorangium cellulosum]